MQWNIDIVQLQRVYQYRLARTTLLSSRVDGVVVVFDICLKRHGLENLGDSACEDILLDVCLHTKWDTS